MFAIKFIEGWNGYLFKRYSFGPVICVCRTTVDVGAVAYLSIPTQFFFWKCGAEMYKSNRNYIDIIEGLSRGVNSKQEWDLY